MSSLRERKRRATKLAIIDHATALALKNGYDNVTVEEICEAAQISKRTFFNYVECKDYAILGSPPKVISEQDREEFISTTHTELIHDIILLCKTHLDFEDTTNEIMQRRKKILRDNKDLIHMHHSATTNFFDSVEKTIEEYYAAHPSEVPFPDAQSCIANYVMGIIRLGITRWFADHTDPHPSLEKHIERAFHDFRATSVLN